LVKMVIDMITPEGITVFRDKIIQMLRELTGKTENEIDDAAIELLVTHALTLGNVGKYGLPLVSMAKGYVVMSETQWDDKFGLPLLQHLEEILQAMAADEGPPAEEEIEPVPA